MNLGGLNGVRGDKVLSVCSIVFIVNIQDWIIFNFDIDNC